MGSSSSEMHRVAMSSAVCVASSSRCQCCSTEEGERRESERREGGAHLDRALLAVGEQVLLVVHLAVRVVDRERVLDVGGVAVLLVGGRLGRVRNGLVEGRVGDSVDRVLPLERVADRNHGDGRGAGVCRARGGARGRGGACVARCGRERRREKSEQDRSWRLERPRRERAGESREKLSAVHTARTRHRGVQKRRRARGRGGAGGGTARRPRGQSPAPNSEPIRTPRSLA